MSASAASHDTEPDTRTAPDDPSPARSRRARWLRRVFSAALTLFLLGAALNVYGVRTADVRAAAGDYELSVHYAEVTRPGLATPWSVEVRRAGGFDEEITLRTTGSYFDLFDENGLDPDPASATSDGEDITWQFDPPEGEVLSISFDARIEPAVQLTWIDAETSVLGPDGEPEVTVRYRTLVLP